MTSPADADGASPQPVPPAVSQLQESMRQVLTLASLSRTVMARRLGMSVHDLEAMEQVMLSGEPLGPVDISRRLGVTSAAATQSVHRLEAAGHVVRERHPSDGRRQVLQVTPGGAAHVFAVLQPLLTLTATAAEGLDEREQSAVALYLARTVDAYRGFIDLED